MKDVKAFYNYLLRWRDQMIRASEDDITAWPMGRCTQKAEAELYERGPKVRQAARQEASAQGVDPLLLPSLEKAWEAAKAYCELGRREAGFNCIGWAEGWPLVNALNEINSLLPPSTPAEVTDNEGDVLARVLEVADPSAARIIAIAGDGELSVDDKLRAIAEIDLRFLAYTPAKWAKLLGATRQAVEKTRWWTIDRPALIEKNSD